MISTREFLSAGKSGDLDTIKEALTSEYSTEIINCSDESFQDKKTCLMLASENGRTDVVKHLLTSKANCNLFDNWGYTALMLAAQMDRADIVALLLKHGANATLKNSSGQTALDIAKTRAKVIGKPLECIDILEGNTSSVDDSVDHITASPAVSSSRTSLSSSSSKARVEVATPVPGARADPIDRGSLAKERRDDLNTPVSSKDSSSNNNNNSSSSSSSSSKDNNNNKNSNISSPSATPNNNINNNKSGASVIESQQNKGDSSNIMKLSIFVVILAAIAGYFMLNKK